MPSGLSSLCLESSVCKRASFVKLSFLALSACNLVNNDQGTNTNSFELRLTLMNLCGSRQMKFDRTRAGRLSDWKLDTQTLLHWLLPQLGISMLAPATSSILLWKLRTSTRTDFPAPSFLATRAHEEPYSSHSNSRRRTGKCGRSTTAIAARHPPIHAMLHL